jgi:hypothetical protein
VVDALKAIDPKYPKVEGAALAELEKVRAALLAESPKKKS